MSEAPELGYYISVRYKNRTMSVERDQYLQAVVSSETYPINYYIGKGLTQKQAAEFYRAQAITSNSYVEHTRKVYSNHRGQDYTVCDTDHCQKYDPTLIHQAAVNAVASMYYIYSEYAEAALILHTPSTGKYDYIYAGFFSSCYNRGTDTHPNQPELKAVSCSDIAEGYGHGSHAYGLCQMGAANLAKRGYSAVQIVNYYYTDCVVKYCPVF